VSATKKKQKRAKDKASKPKDKGKASEPAKKPEKVKATPKEQRAHGVSIALAMLSGCLWFLACADFDIWPFAYIAMLPAFFVVERAPTRRKALFYGWLAGAVANAGGFYWVSGLLERFGHMPFVVAVIGLLLLAAYQAVVFWLFFWVVRSIRLQSRELLGTPLPMVLLAPVVMVSFEYLVPFLFPWYLAITQAWLVPVIQIAELTGPLGVTAFLMVINGALYDLITERGPRRKKIAIAAVSIVALVLVYGFVRISQIDARRADAPALKVGVVQGNIPFDEKGINRSDLAAQQLRELQAKSAELEGKGAEFIMWTESSYPYGVPRDAKTDFQERDGRRIRSAFAVYCIGPRPTGCSGGTG
jgi:apolipoprotein N-acyltransferase